METEIDDSLYSRQRYVLGDSAMHKMARSSIFLSGLEGLGVEIAKNVVLAGVKSLTIHDNTSASWMDLSSQFFLSEEDVAKGKNRAEASVSKLTELNPYVTVQSATFPFTADSNLEFLNNYQCVIVTNASLELQLYVDNYCRSHQPPIKFISGSVRGVFSTVFCDFGPEFLIHDKNGEEPAEFFIGEITKENPGVVKCLENHMHYLETGDQVTFKEIVGMTAINGTTHTVKVLNIGTFSIGDTSGAEYYPYQHGGIARQLKATQKISFESLAPQLKKPSLLLVDLAKLETPLQAHLAFLTLEKFLVLTKALPKPRNNDDADVFVRLATETNADYNLVEVIDGKLMRQFCLAASGTLPPLAAAIGGVVAQEALISLTGKFSPLHQWLYVDACEVLGSMDESIDTSSLFIPKGDRYDGVRVCLGEETLQKLAHLNLFMVGCGAIGCEMLKNYAMLGIGRNPNGKVTITDYDLIEKSNLNRQFLFRSHHIQKAKSLIAAQSTLAINPELCIVGLEHKVFPGTQESVFHDEFFQAQNIVVNALDNVAARRYVDSRCVSNKCPLLESGTMGAKGHVQVILPHKTESYSSQQDPPDKDVPYCTLKSFPATIEHTIQWARDKFESLFTQKPAMYSKFWETHTSPQHIVEMLHRQNIPDGAVKVVKLLQSWPKDWTACVQQARIKFERYFNHKALNLIHAFPIDTKMKDGSLFWQSPKRPPTPLIFDINNPMHMAFIVSTANLQAAIYNIPHSDEDVCDSVLTAIIDTTVVPTFRASSKEVVTDETVKKPEVKETPMEIIDSAISNLVTVCSSGVVVTQEKMRMTPQSFEKDDDDNGHIDFITAASNLRAAMYLIEPVDRFKTKLIAGRIVPAIATTTAAIAGLMSIELIKVILDQPLECFKNAFLNLALPCFIFSEPAPPIKTVINERLHFTLWDRWEIQGTDTLKLKDFLKCLRDKYGLEPAMVVLGVKMIYVPWMPGHTKRLTQTMVQLLRPRPNTAYVDLIVSFENINGEEVPGPPVRYYIR